MSPPRRIPVRKFRWRWATRYMTGFSHGLHDTPQQAGEWLRDNAGQVHPHPTLVAVVDGSWEDSTTKEKAEAAVAFTRPVEGSAA